VLCDGVHWRGTALAAPLIVLCGFCMLPVVCIVSACLFTPPPFSVLYEPD
jgi:hypothetical protein